MKICLAVMCLGFCSVVAFGRNNPPAPATSAAPWREVDDALNHGLPKTALAAVDRILPAALARRDYPQAIEAMARKAILTASVEGRGLAGQIASLQAQAAQAPTPMRPLLEVILADWYWHYFGQNRWRLARRTAVAEASDADITTWDLRRLLAEIDRHFTAALAGDAALKRTPIAQFDGLLKPGTIPDAYRPTLYDFVAHEALAFYQAGEQGVPVGEDVFELSADSPIFDDADAFLRWRMAKPAASSAPLKAVRLYQALLAYHRDDGNRSAFLDADLGRLHFGANSSVGDNKDERYRGALQRFIARAGDDPIAARATYLLAFNLREAGKLARAHDLAGSAAKRFTGTVAAAECSALVQRIEEPSADLDTEYVWNAPWPTLDVTYANVTKLYFRAVPIPATTHLSRWAFDLKSDEVTEFAHQAAAWAWVADLPATADFQRRTENIPVPTDLRHGHYVIIASANADFRSGTSLLAVAPVWVSDLSILIRSGPHPRALVVRASTGEPIAGATVKGWAARFQHDFNLVEQAVTDENGEVELSTERPVILTAELGDDIVGAMSDVYPNHFSPPPPAESHTTFFTDRAIYRPGQSIQYKAVVVAYDTATHEYSASAGRSVTIIFRDPNGQEIARQTAMTNDYGSVAGVFVAPSGRLTGRMSLLTEDQTGQTAVDVEEYKRPKFDVQLPAPTAPPKLGQRVDLTGHATAYTGATIGGAKVAWRVVRAVRMPPWCWWWPAQPTKAIAHGITTTADDGSFRVSFVAEPDRKVPRANEPVFNYTVYADVTDTTGETHSEHRDIPVGYTALRATLTCAEWQTPESPVDLTVTTATLGGEPTAATGTLTISTLREPARVTRAKLTSTGWTGEVAKPTFDPANPETWEQDRAVATLPVTTDDKGQAHAKSALPAGVYRAVLGTQDRFGQPVKATLTFTVIDPADTHQRTPIPSRLTAMDKPVEPGATFRAVWGTGYASGRALVEVECGGRSIQKYWTAAGRTQVRIDVPVDETMRGGFTLRTTYVRENRAYIAQRVIDVPWTNQQLHVTWGTFRSKLRPGEPETWQATITGPDQHAAAAEMVATLYDASLDQFDRHAWPTELGTRRTQMSTPAFEFQNGVTTFNAVSRWLSPVPRRVVWSYRHFVPELHADMAAGDAEDEDGDGVQLMPFEVRAGARGMSYSATSNTLAGTRLLPLSKAVTDSALALPVVSAALSDVEPAESAPSSPVTEVVPRRNLQETAFFYPKLLTDADGVVRISFTAPEALTRWRFLGFAHDRGIRTGMLTGEAVTAKELMVEPNPPRFVREGDTIEFTVKVTNLSDAPQRGHVRLNFSDAETQRRVDDSLGNRAPEQPFDVPAQQSRTFAWRITVPDGLGFVTYRAVAAADKFSDGEEAMLPVLSRRVLVTESLPLPIRGPATKEFTFTKLVESAGSPTLRSQALTVQMTSQPAWYAVLALPYLMEFPYECSEQVFNRYYANALAHHIASSNPKIKRAFEQWANTAALDSPLEKNPELKSVALEETPWVVEAKSESQARRRIGLLFDENHSRGDAEAALHKLTERRGDDGLWSWFPGGAPSEYISLYILAGFGRLRHLGVPTDQPTLARTVAALDRWIDERVREIRGRPHPEQYVPSASDALYLYARSFFLNESPIGNRPAVDFLLSQARTYWLQTNCRQSQGQLALALQRFGDAKTAMAIMRSLKERSVDDAEMGMSWRDDGAGWWWYDAPIETQAVMIEAFDEVAHDVQAVDDCRVWLLQQKRTQDWRTTKATADAIYALLLRGSDLLASDAEVEVSLGGERIQPDAVEAGTGFYEQKFGRGEIKPAMGHITVTKPDAGVSWGSVHWQYLEDVAKITPHAGTPLTLKKTLFVKRTTAHGQELTPVRGPLAVGDELVVRLELRTDRDMEFIHLKDQRASGTEPVDVLSRYRYQDGLGYYESTRDTATHFFIEHLRRGTYVFEYSSRVQLKGRYQTGIAEIQCMYAPEFNSHSESIALEVK